MSQKMVQVLITLFGCIIVVNLRESTSVLDPGRASGPWSLNQAASSASLLWQLPDLDGGGDVDGGVDGDDQNDHVDDDGDQTC